MNCCVQYPHTMDWVIWVGWGRVLNLACVSASNTSSPAHDSEGSCTAVVGRGFQLRMMVIGASGETTNCNVARD